MREVRGEEEDSCGGGCDGGGGAGGYKEVEIPNEVMGVRGAQNGQRAGGGTLLLLRGTMFDVNYRRHCAAIRAYGGCYLNVLGDVWENTKIKNKFIFGGLRRPPFDEDRHNNQPKTRAYNRG